MYLYVHTKIMTIKAIAFDLDDTLLNTSGLLAPQATKKAFQILIDNGLNLNLDECEKIRTEMVKTVSHKDVFRYLASQFGNSSTLNSCDKAIAAFYHPDIPDHLPLLDDALDNLNKLFHRYNLYLVTAGINESQNKKIDSLAIRHFFKKIYITDSLNKERKKDAFVNILKNENILAENLLCIGNSLSSEIKDGLELGCMTCYFEFGEDRGPINEQLKPHFQVKKHQNLIATCHL